MSYAKESFLDLEQRKIGLKLLLVVMRKTIEVIETEWDKRRRIKERDELNKSRPSKKERKKAKDKLRSREKFINKAAAKLRVNTPKSELWFKKFLVSNNLNNLFLNNVRLNDLIPDYINLEHKIIIEVDGSVHWNNDKQLARDKQKDAIYNSMGYTVYRVNHYDNVKAQEIIKDILIKVTPLQRYNES